MTLPVVHVDGSPYQQGRLHGLALRDQVTHNLEVYYARLLLEGQLERDEARDRAARYLSLLESHPYMAALSGMAAATGHELLDLLVLNLRYELLYYQYGVCAVGGADGCTSFAVLPQASANGHLLLGQNWDWIPQVKGALVHTREPDGLETLAFTEAGIVGAKIGLNSAGLGLTINGLMTTADDWSRQVLPFHVRCYEILRQQSLSEARQVIESTPRSCAGNFLLAQTPDSALDIEAAPDALCEREPRHGLLVHTNHFLDPEQMGVVEPAAERRPHSYLRQSRMSALLERRVPLAVEDLERSLSDHQGFPDSVCRHVNSEDPPEEWCVTVTSAIMDLDELSLRLTDGPPCEHVYEGLALPRHLR